MAVGTGAVDDMLARCTRLGYCSSGVWVVARRSSDDMLAAMYMPWLLRLGGVGRGAKVLLGMVGASVAGALEFVYRGRFACVFGLAVFFLLRN